MASYFDYQTAFASSSQSAVNSSSFSLSEDTDLYESENDTLDTYRSESTSGSQHFLATFGYAVIQKAKGKSLNFIDHSSASAIDRRFHIS